MNFAIAFRIGILGSVAWKNWWKSKHIHQSLPLDHVLLCKDKFPWYLRCAVWEMRRKIITMPFFAKIWTNV